MIRQQFGILFMFVTVVLCNAIIALNDNNAGQEFNAIKPQKLKGARCRPEPSRTTPMSQTTPIATTDDDPRPATASRICPDGYHGLLPHPYNCTLYYYCNIYEYLQRCPDGLYFNPVTADCDYHQNVPECVGSPPTTLDPNTWVCPDWWDGYIAHPYNCSLFYLCSKPPELLQCPSPLVYNEATEECDWAYNVPECYCNYPTPTSRTTTRVPLP